MTQGEPARPPVRAPARTRTTRRIALTGGIGSGKTAVSDLLRQQGAVVIDSDELAREVVAPGTPGLAAVAEAFGPDVLAADGSLDRAALGRVVFADADARRRLEGIVHPLVRARAAELERAVPAGAVVVHVIPLLVETGQAERFATVVVVDVPEDVQVARLVAARGLTEDDARARMAAQSSRAGRLAVADHVLDNAGPPEDLERAVAALWQRLRQDADMDDKDITGHIQELVDEENRLRVDGAEGLTDAERHARLTEVEERLDQYWDLLRQRRAREEFGADPDVAARRPVDEVESYEQ